MSHYIEYYDSQVGSGGVDHVFVGSPYQKGHGIGQFLGGLFRKALPFLKRGAKAVGREALRAGMHIIDDVSTHNVPFKNALRNRAYESTHNLKRKAEEKIDNLMKGSGYKRGARKLKKQLPGKRRRRRVSKKNKLKKTKKVIRKKKPVKRNKKKKQRTISDIFGPAY